MNQQPECRTGDVLVIGCGIAGGTAAIKLADAGLKVMVLAHGQNINESNTFYAQGGIIYRGENDSIECLSNDLFHAGAKLNYPAAVRIFAEQGPQLVVDFLVKRIGVEFDRDATGNLECIKEAAHSSARIVHATDITGKAIQSSLGIQLLKHPNIDILSNHTAIDLLTPAHHSLDRLAVYESNSCIGAYALDNENNEVIRCIAKKVVLATGGLGQIFLNTSNPAGARGDGLAMANRSGARIVNSEYIQFHPTTFYHKHAPRFLISEAVRGAGATLINENGEAFMEKYSQKWKDLAPRDVVARSIHTEMIRLSTPNVYLDLSSYISSAKIEKKFPSIFANCIKYGIDIRKTPVPVTPAAHYNCGGVLVDEWGSTTIQNLYVVGEVACTGLHGANRLGSSSLLEGLVWGARAAENIAQSIPGDEIPASNKIPRWQALGHEQPDPVLISQDMDSIRNIMWNYVGLVRTTVRLERAVRELRHLESEIERFYRVSSLTDELIGLRNAIRTASVVTTAAQQNKVSLGCHYRES
ncbi:MAG: L-aspartate oxidase [Calditrichaeota bacterium]|nr:MAG: L-aspartate oxidase [Calditrichota bacterium]